METWHYWLFFLTGVITGPINAMSGGGGLITLPVLLSFGMPPQLALGTAKLQGTLGAVSSVWHYQQKGVIKLREFRSVVAFSFLGAVLGATIVQCLDSAFLSKLIPWFLAVLFIYSVLQPKLGEHDHPPKLNWGFFALSFGSVLGFYNGFFGPATGTLWAAALVLVQGMNLVRAVGYSRLMNATGNIAALVVFLINGNVDWLVGLVMGAGQLVGTRFGVHFVVRRGVVFLRPIFFGMMALTIGRLIYLSLCDA